MASASNAKDDQNHKSSPNTGTSQDRGLSANSSTLARPRPCPTHPKPQQLHPSIGALLGGHPPTGQEWLWERKTKTWCLHLTYCAQCEVGMCALWACALADGSQSWEHFPKRADGSYVAAYDFYSESEVEFEAEKHPESAPVTDSKQTSIKDTIAGKLLKPPQDRCRSEQELMVTSPETSEKGLTASLSKTLPTPCNKQSYERPAASSANGSASPSREQQTVQCNNEGPVATPSGFTAPPVPSSKKRKSPTSPNSLLQPSPKSAKQIPPASTNTTSPLQSGGNTRRGSKGRHANRARRGRRHAVRPSLTAEGGHLMTISLMSLNKALLEGQATSDTEAAKKCSSKGNIGLLSSLISRMSLQ